ncbi:hypothetical protein GCM10018965_049740 [Nonomuraea roseola]
MVEGAVDAMGHTEAGAPLSDDVLDLDPIWREPVGAENGVPLSDLRVLMDQATEAVSANQPSAARQWGGSDRPFGDVWFRVR